MSKNLENMMEDYSLEAVPAEMRRPWRELAAVGAGIGSSLAVLLTGGMITYMAGFWMGMLAAFIAFLVSTFFTISLGIISFRDGYSSNIISRAYAFGTRGSAFGSLIWAFMIIGFLGMESVLIGNSLLFYFDIEPTFFVKFIFYLIITGIWIVLSLFGNKLVSRVAQIMIPLLFLMLLFMVYLLMNKGSLLEAVTHGILIPNMTAGQGFAIALNATIVLAGLLAIVVADFTRFSKSSKDVVKVSVVSNFSLYGVTMVFGAIITYFGYQITMDYFLDQGMKPGAAGMAAITNPGIMLVLGGGVWGLLTIIFSQSKVQVGNSYEGALALVNLFDTGFNWRPGRAVMVVLANITSLLFIFGNILHYIETFLTFGSVLLCVWVTIVLTDYYVIRGKMKIGKQGIEDLANIPAVNWKGLLTLVVSTIIGMFFYQLNWFGVPFMIATPIAFVLYTGLSLLKVQSAVPEESQVDI
ncbi:purine-cytosine permease family protein [Bacillus sp. 1NLA3E]|uniref:purine-cytosine permease family protein n=1 Tax=Bacillus sp. 1NLA3E TaxID=666686 RepID=UPI000247EFEA|nr:cytosine permease [Bacillus sp. 1NLA3E]